MIRMAQEKGIRHVMGNTNGRRIAREATWAAQLGELRPMIYLQFDGWEDETYIKLRGEPLLEEKLAALDLVGQTVPVQVTRGFTNSLRGELSART